MIRKAKYHGIPCTFNDETNGLYGKNWFWDKLVDLNLWLDTNFFMVEVFDLWIEIPEDEMDEFKRKNNL